MSGPSRAVSEPYIWEPFERQVVFERLRGLTIPWWFAGGHAIDGFLGYESRSHGDIDIACFRQDQVAMQRQLGGMDIWCAEPPGKLRPWQAGEVLPGHVHDIWCRESEDGPWRLQLMLDEAYGDEWVYRREPKIRRPIDELITIRDGVPFLAVEVQLLYKAGRPGSAMPVKNQKDFEACFPLLNDAQRAWLASGLRIAHPECAWLERLRFDGIGSDG